MEPRRTGVGRAAVNHRGACRYARMQRRLLRPTRDGLPTVAGHVCRLGAVPTVEDAEERRRLLWSLLGDLPDRTRPVIARRVDREERDGCVVERLMLDLNGIELVPALFVTPAGRSGPFPLVFYQHWHDGSKELLISPGGPAAQAPYGPALAARGVASLAIDHWNFGERRGRMESALFKEMLWHGRVLWGMMVYDAVRAVDYALSRPEVDGARLATIGMSMGSTMSWWLAALDPRVKVCVDICCLTDFRALIETNGLDGHGIYYYVPSLLKHFGTADINALIAPRPHLSLAGDFDPLTPPAGLQRVDARLREVYAAAGAPEAWRLVRYHVGHVETAAMRADALQWLDRWL